MQDILPAAIQDRWPLRLTPGNRKRSRGWGQRPRTKLDHAGNQKFSERCSPGGAGSSRSTHRQSVGGVAPTNPL